MLTRAIACLNCGHEGEIEVDGLANDVEPSRIFRHCGHNPFSGHMHYQCPACEIILLVDPMSVLGRDTIAVASRRFLPEMTEGRRIDGLPQMERGSLFQKLFPSHREGY